MDFVCRQEAAPGGGGICWVSGEVDLSNADELRDRALEAYGTHGSPLTIDLSEVTFMDSSGVHALLAVHRQTRQAGGAGELALRGVTRAVLRTLSLLGVAPLFALTPAAPAVPAAPAAP